MFLRLLLAGSRRSRRIVALTVLAFGVLHAVTLTAVGTTYADQQREQLALERSGPSISELDAFEQVGRSAQPGFLRASLAVPSTRGEVTWTRYVARGAEPVIPGRRAPLNARTSYVSPSVQGLITSGSDEHLEGLLLEQVDVLPPSALAGPGELVILSVLSVPREASLEPAQAMPGPPGQPTDVGAPTVEPEGSGVSAALLAIAALFASASLARLAGSARHEELATLRLIGMTPRKAKTFLLLYGTLLNMVAGLVVAPVAVLLGRSELSLRVLSVEYFASEIYGSPPVLFTTVLGTTLMSALASTALMRALKLHPLDVSLGRRVRSAGQPRRLLLRGGALGVGTALLTLAAIMARSGSAWPDGLLLLLQVLGLLLTLAGAIGLLPMEVSVLARLLRRPRSLFTTGQQLNRNPAAAVSGAWPVASVALAAGLIAATGPTSSPPPVGMRSFTDSMIEVSVPDGDARVVSSHARRRIPGLEQASFQSGYLVAEGKEMALLRGSCRSISSVLGRLPDNCTAGDLYVPFPSQLQPGTVARLETFAAEASSAGQERPVTAALQGIEPGTALLAAEPEAGPTDVLVVPPQSSSKDVTGEVVRAAGESGQVFQPIVGDVDAQAYRFSRMRVQAQLNALLTMLLALAAVVAIVSSAVSSYERRRTILSMRYVGFQRVDVAISLTASFGVPVVVAAFSMSTLGYLTGWIFGAVIDGRDVPGPAPVILALTVVSLCAIITGGAAAALFARLPLAGDRG